MTGLFETDVCQRLIDVSLSNSVTLCSLNKTENCPWLTPVLSKPPDSFTDMGKIQGKYIKETSSQTVGVLFKHYNMLLE